MHRSIGHQIEGYQAPTRFYMPEFTKGDVVEWISKCESYFDLDKTPVDNRVGYG